LDAGPKSKKGIISALKRSRKKAQVSPETKIVNDRGARYRLTDSYHKSRGSFTREGQRNRGIKFTRGHGLRSGPRT